MESAMTVEEAEESLPNGLHDAEIETVFYDLAAKTLTLRIFVWVCAMDNSPFERELYRRAALNFSSVHFFAKTTPRNVVQDPENKILAVQNETLLPDELKHQLPDGVSTYMVYMGYSEIEIAARATSFEWTTEEVVNRRPAPKQHQ
jgi:hypothetical protein